MRLGILGGTFDPVHFGHLLLAEYCREEAGLDEVWFMPASVPPHKRDERITSGKDRVEMLELAIAGNEAFRVSTLEIETGGVNYSSETLQRLHDEDPERELFFLMGADSLNDLPRWHRPDRICALATPLVVRRPGSPEPDYGILKDLVAAERLKAFEETQVEFPQIDLSSTEIRRRVAAGKSIRYQTPRAVEKYIETHELYRAGGGGE